MADQQDKRDGQHQGDEVTRPFAVSVCLSAIALYASLADDLSA